MRYSLMSIRLSSDSEEPTKTCPGSKTVQQYQRQMPSEVLSQKTKNPVKSKLLTSQKTKSNSTLQIMRKHNWVPKILPGTADLNPTQDCYTKCLQWWLQSLSRFTTVMIIIILVWLDVITHKKQVTDSTWWYWR